MTYAPQPLSPLPGRGVVPYSEGMNMADKIPASAPPLTDRPRSDYPLSGAKTGPAWRAAWDCLRLAHVSADRYVAGSAVAEYVGARVPDVSPDTVKNLLLSAERHGVLVKRYDMLHSRRQAHFRISDEWIREQG